MCVSQSVGVSLHRGHNCVLYQLHDRSSSNSSSSSRSSSSRSSSSISEHIRDIDEKINNALSNQVQCKGDEVISAVNRAFAFHANMVQAG